MSRFGRVWQLLPLKFFQGCPPTPGLLGPFAETVLRSACAPRINCKRSASVAPLFCYRVSSARRPRAHRLRKVVGNVADVLPIPSSLSWKRWLGAVTRVLPTAYPSPGQRPSCKDEKARWAGQPSIATTASACSLQSYYAVLGTYRTDAPLMIRLLNREPTVMCDGLVPLTNKNAKYGTRHERRRSNAAICARRNEQCVKL